MEGEGTTPSPDRVTDPERLARLQALAREMLAYDREAFERDMNTGEGKRRAESGAALEPFSPIKKPED